MWPDPEPLDSSFPFRDEKAQNVLAQPVFTDIAESLLTTGFK